MYTIKEARMKQRKITNTVTYILLAVWAIIVLFPFYWMILTSVKSYGAYNSEYIPKFFTWNPTLQNYADAFTEVPLGRYFLNTTIFTVVTTAIMLVVITLAAFAFARLEFKGKNIVFVFIQKLLEFEIVFLTSVENTQAVKCIVSGLFGKILSDQFNKHCFGGDRVKLPGQLG